MDFRRIDDGVTPYHDTAKLEIVIQPLAYRRAQLASGFLAFLG